MRSKMKEGKARMHAGGPVDNGCTAPGSLDTGEDYAARGCLASIHLARAWRGLR